MTSVKACAPHRKGHLIPVVLAAFLVATLAACGSGSTGDNGSVAAGSSEATATSADAASAAPGSVAPAPADTDNGSSSDAGNMPNACAFLKDLFHGAGGGPSDLPPDQLIAVLAGLPDRVPPEIRDDVRVLASAFTSFAQLLQQLGVKNAGDVGSLSAADQQRVQDAFAAMDTGEAGDAIQRVDYYLVGKSEC
jgi:hypothetical protein